MRGKLRNRHTSDRPKKRLEKDEKPDLFERQVREKWIGFLKGDISELELSAETKQELESAGITSVLQLVQLTGAEILEMRLGNRSLEDIEGLFSKLGLALGMNQDFLETLYDPQKRKDRFDIPRFSTNAMNSSGDLALWIYATEWMKENGIHGGGKLLEEFPQLYKSIEAHMMIARRANRPEAQIFADLLGVKLPKN